MFWILLNQLDTRPALRPLYDGLIQHAPRLGQDMTGFWLGLLLSILRGLHAGVAARSRNRETVRRLRVTARKGPAAAFRWLTVWGCRLAIPARPRVALDALGRTGRLLVGA